MVEIDHSLVNAPPPPPEPALPILASHLLDLEERQRRRFVGSGRGERLSTGCREADEVLGGDGGVERGIMLGISAPVEGREGRLLSLNLLASGLLPNLTPPLQSRPASPPRTKATIIDTTGSYPLALLASVLKSRLLEAQSLSARKAVKTGNHPIPGLGNSEDPAVTEHAAVDEAVQRCLEMVAISRVFDVEGLWEVIGEVDHDSSSSLDHGPGSENERGLLNVADVVEVVVEQDIGDEGPETLDREDHLTPPGPPAVSKELRDQNAEDEGTEIIIVDNMTHIINELFARKEKSEAHTLLSLLSSTLNTLSKTQNILTILHNTTNPASSSSTSSSSTTTNYPNPNPRPQKATRNALHASTARSIFSSAATKPALGQIFARFPDLHLFLHSLPRSREDAELLYAGEDGSAMHGDGGGGVVRYVTVIEVLKDEAPALLGTDAHGLLGGGAIDKVSVGGKDGEVRRRFAYREQRWTAVDVTPHGTGLVCTFSKERGGVTGLGMGQTVMEGV